MLAKGASITAQVIQTILNMTIYCFYSLTRKEPKKGNKHVVFNHELLSVCSHCSLGGESEVGFQPGEHREDEVSKRGVLCDEEAGRVDVCMLQGGLLLGRDVLLLRAVPHLLQAAPGRQGDVCSGIVHGLVLHQPPLLFIQLRQDGHSGLVLKAWSWRVSGHVGVNR